VVLSFDERRQNPFQIFPARRRWTQRAHYCVAGYHNKNSQMVRLGQYATSATTERLMPKLSPTMTSAKKRNAGARAARVALRGNRGCLQNAHEPSLLLASISQAFSEQESASRCLQT